MPLVKGVPNFPSEHRHPIWYGKTRMAWPPDGEKNIEDIFIRFDVIHERDGRTDTECICIAR